ncbi:MAG: GTP 3',8-cyclase MoaA [Candidatus Bathyarchaeota archaeon]|nr:MAG: GTP 3',8-cyclase MoaA [Candidatus Bathyarchaeota archaeon]
MVLVDNYGRPTLSLRIAVTQNCNLRCGYCHREGETTTSNPEEMTEDEIVGITEVAISLGITRVKLTGGEPLHRKDIVDIISRINKLRGLQDLAITTNGCFLASLAKDLAAAGLRRVNVNIPTLDTEKYRNLTGGNLRNVINGIREAVRVGLFPVKLNMVLLRDVNTTEIERMISFAEQTGTILQLIELEPINVSKEYYKKHHYELDEVENRLKKEAYEVKTRKHMQNRRIYFLPRAKVEVVHPIENTEFCQHCTRLRVTSNGKLKPCLLKNGNLVDVLTPMRNGADDKELTQLFIEAVKRREPYCHS